VATDGTSAAGFSMFVMYTGARASDDLETNKHISYTYVYVCLLSLVSATDV